MHSWVQFCIGIVQRFDRGLEIAIFTQPPQMTPPNDFLFEVIDKHALVFSTVAIYVVFHPFSVNPPSFPEIKIECQKFM